MKFGSVKFFKMVILATLALLILVPTVLAVVFGAGYSSRGQEMALLNDELENVSEQLTQAQAQQNALPIPEESEPDTGRTPQTVDYQSLYPDMLVEDAPDWQLPEGSICYLTFDDGPSELTVQNLDLLASENIKATFFVTGANSEANPDILKRIVAEGHTLGVHTYSHDYAKVYSSVEDYLDDFYKIWNTVYEITGVKATVFRFAGGSINAYNRTVYQAIIAEMLRRGFTYYDWNVAAGDAAADIPPATILKNVTANITRHQIAVVLLHDRSDNVETTSALPQMITYIREQGYTFAALDNSIQPITFAYENLK